MVFLPIVRDRLSRNLKVRLAESVHMVEVRDFYCILLLVFDRSEAFFYFSFVVVVVAAL